MADLCRLQYFVAVARERNFTRAAERLHVAQPALSRQVRLILCGDAVAIVGESSSSGLPDELCWLALSPEASLEVGLVVRRSPRSPAVARMLEVAKALSGQLGWI